MGLRGSVTPGGGRHDSSTLPQKRGHPQTRTMQMLSPGRAIIGQSVNKDTTSTRKGPSSARIEKAKGVSTPSKQSVNDEEIRIKLGRSGAGKSSRLIGQLTGKFPLEDEEDDTSRTRRRTERADTLPSSTIPTLELPEDPRIWSPTRLSAYPLSTRDLTAFAKEKQITGKTF
ncbi:hypothetical protein K443DRAFT_12977 [Laccaria amethystina LaAM-08-1]|uniref:Uncharacterized protein n=1 Tax=Laccaria amethystina LaAM-08-1 TaxID=1095629 RepID=A0A0C9WIP0_9AGAR|nr:hypothetical protein K443DRAFT_12977 [Laccaria amethystina LaAM-08-1]